MTLLPYILLLETVGDHLSTDDAPYIDKTPRIVVFEMDQETGAKSVLDIMEHTHAWGVVDSALHIHGHNDLAIVKEDGTLQSLDTAMGYKTHRARVRNVLRALEARYKTGLDTKQPNVKYRRAPMTTFQEIAADIQAKQAFIIGPNQEAWLQALESGKYKQGYGRLKDIVGCLCCLGVLCEVAKIESHKISHHTWTYDSHTGTVPESAIAFAALVDDTGGRLDHAPFRCTFMNDSRRYSFKMIASAIRAEPEQYFTESR